jgi:hypothetical protein
MKTCTYALFPPTDNWLEHYKNSFPIDIKKTPVKIRPMRRKRTKVGTM